MNSQKSFVLLPGLVVLLSGFFVFTASFATPLAAALPPRPTLTPAATSLLPTATPLTPTAAPLPQRATIMLQAGPAYEGAWTVVQWQGSDGVWHDVEGWKGHVRGGQVRWRVAEKDFGAGPFRWLVYDAPGGPLTAVSDSFTLPDSGNHLVTVTVTLVAGDNRATVERY